ncbi:hypothetical protein SAMN05518669_103341 [Variovorax sp. YR634]|uniref:glycine-rich domain-containing protein n=1 Tax=Variovorax sp. YR634 TaxID=1884385 RepID=UPI0008943E82|nr:hypothetical protein [Variovorax sp. YR634]SDX12234.1 hypothetical protein SAMN05518669_103341 [Variovorax sp. YR634]
MDRNINYPGQVPLETDLLKTNQFTMIGLSRLAAAILGTASCVSGFATTQTVVPSMAVLVAPGDIYSLQNLEGTAYSSLPQDLTHNILKQGISLDARTIAVAAPGTAGFSVNYLIQASYQDTDGGSTVLPYYNASNPSVAYSGPANSGTAQPTTRAGAVAISAKAGTAATTGTQTTPAPDAGYVGLYVVTVANGASTVVNANISAYSLAPFIPAPFVKPMARFTSSGSFVVPWYVTTVYVTGVGGGGGGGGTLPVSATGNIVAGGGGGGAGAAAVREAISVTPGASITVTIGGAGAAGAISGNGGAGGTTSFGSLVVLNGGGGGVLGAGGTTGSAYAGGAGGAGGTAGTGATFAGAVGADASDAQVNVTGSSGFGANSIFGNAGSSRRGAANSNLTGVAATGFGSGGGGGGGSYSGTATSAGAAGGAGKAGFLMIEW